MVQENCASPVNEENMDLYLFILRANVAVAELQHKSTIFTTRKWGTQTRNCRFPGSTLYALEPLPEHFAQAELYKPTSLDGHRCVDRVYSNN